MSEDTFAKMCKDLRARDVRNPDNRQGPSQTTQLLVLTIHNQHVDSVNGLAPARAVAGINTRTALDGLVYDPSGSSDFRHATTELTIFVVNNVEYAVAVHPGNQTAVDELIASIMSNLSSAERRVFRVRKGPSTAVPVRVTCTPTGKVKYYKTMSSALNSYKTDFPGYHLSKHQLDKARTEALRTGETVYTLTDFKLEIISVEQYTASLS